MVGHMVDGAAEGQVFISYASVDVGHAEELHRRLAAEGFTVWFDRARLEAGFRWYDEIAAACEASRVVVPVMTPLWKESLWTRFETYGAETVVPFVFEGAWPEVATPPLQEWQAHAPVLDARAAGDDGWGWLFSAIRLALAKDAPVKAARVRHLRHRPNPHFVGREKELLAIHEALHRCPTAVLTSGRVQAVTALGGVGKTTLAREYAERYWRLYRDILWVDAGSGDPTPGFADVGRLLDPRAPRDDDPRAAKLALRLLEEDGGGRLLVIDNAVDEERIQDWVPRSGGCRTLITSRFAGWSAAVESLNVWVLEPEPSRELLLKRAGRPDTPENRSAADRLAEALGFLPLALEQAAAYVAESGEGFGFGDYLRLYREAAEVLLAEKALGSTRYPDSVMTTWQLGEAGPGGAGGSERLMLLCR